MKLHYNITESNPIVKDNYPYGFKRTQIRYYLETTKQGDRFVSQTLNPKTNEWNKPKKSTYSNVMIIAEDERGYIKHKSFSYYADKEEFEKFLRDVDVSQLNQLQQEKIKEFSAILETRKYIKYECKARRFKHKVTGEITESIPIFQMNDYEEVIEEDDKKETSGDLRKLYSYNRHQIENKPIEQIKEDLQQERVIEEL